MKKKGIALTGLGVCLLISSCTYDKDPFSDFKNEAKEKYIEYYEKNPNVEKAPLFYFDIGTLRSALVRNENEVSFLGQMKLVDFTFSESKNYFCDIGNLPISVTDADNDGMPDRFKVGDFVCTDENGNTNFDVKTFINNLPLVLYEVQPDNSLKTYSMLSSDGTIHESSDVKAYNPDFFYISDLKLNVQGLEGFADELLDFTGKDVCILRKDLYQVLSELTATAIPEQVQNFFSVSNLFNGLYRKAKGLSSNDEMPQSLTIEGTHYSNSKEDSKREVVVGPFSLINELLNQLVTTDSTAETSTSLIHEIPSIYIEEGVTTVSLFAFNGKREGENSTSKIKSIYLPSTLQNVQFNAFSNLDLNSLYIDKTFKTTADGNKEEKPFDFVDFGDIKISMGEGENKLELDVTGSFSHSTIQNLYFEGYDNQNINSFPYSSTLNMNNSEGINKALKIYSKNDGTINTEKTKTLSEAFNKYQIVNPFYQISLAENQDKKYALSSGINTIGKGKTLYLPSQKYSLSTNDSRGIYLGKVNREATPEEALLTLKLDQDLTIEEGGTLIIGSKIGSNEKQSGINVGEFSSLDLNGHKLTVKDGGTLIGDGFIFDSSKENAGKLELKSGAKLTTNITINDYTNLNNTIEKIENGVAPFSSYSLNSLRVDALIEQGATVIGNIDYIDSNFYNENKITFISNSNQALFQLTSGKIVLNKSKISSLNDETNVNINKIDLITIIDNTSSETKPENYGTDLFPFEIGNSTFEVELANVTNLTKICAKEDSKISFKNLTLGNESLLVGAKANSLVIKESIKVADAVEKFTLAGEFSLNNDTYNSFKDIVQKNDGSLIPKYNFNEIKLENGLELLTTGYNLTGFVGQSTSAYSKKILKNASGYYYAYENNGDSGLLVNNNGENLASYSKSSTTWTVNGEDTKVNKDSLISSYGQIDKMHVLKPGKNGFVYWDAINLSTLENGTYESSGKHYIKEFGSNELIEGNFLTETPIKESIFESTLTGKKYANAASGTSEPLWLEIKGFDNYATLQIVHKDAPSDLKFFALINGKYESGFDYNSTQHIVTKKVGVDTKSYVYTNEKIYKEFVYDKLDWKNKQINDGANKLIYLNESSTWASVNELSGGLCKYLMDDGNFYYYFLIEGKWYQSVEGEMAKTYNKLANMSFGVLKNKLTYNGSKYKFVMRNGDHDETPFELFLPQELIKVTKKDFPDLWPTNASTEHLYAYRHIVKNDGSKYLFFKDEATNEVTLKKFEFAPGFTPVQIDQNNTNILTKFNFIIYKVIFEGEVTPRTLYVVTDSSDKNNAIYAGNTNVGEDGALTDEYLAIAIFTTTNPINDLVNGNLPVTTLK